MIFNLQKKELLEICETGYMTDNAKAKYPELESVSDLVADFDLPLFYNNGDNLYNPNSLNVLSLFSGCGGMDLGFEGQFICHNKSVGNETNWIEKKINENWVLLKKNRFNTIFANDILKEAYHTWVKYMKRFGKNDDSFHFASIVDLVKLSKEGRSDVFPHNVDVVLGGFPCQDFSVAGKRKGFNSHMSHDGYKKEADEPSEETRGKLYYWMKQVIEITRPKIFIAENVKGLVSLGDVKDIIQKDFESAGSGYFVFNPQVLHAGNYGVPETRERVFFIGIRLDALNDKARTVFESGNIPDEYNPYPKPTHNYTIKDDNLSSPITCRDVLEGVLEPEESSDLSQQFYSKAKYMGAHCQGQNEINYNGLGPTIRSEHHGNIEYRRLSLEHGGQRIDELKRGLKERRLTPRECALIQTFPPDYTFVNYKGYTKKFQVSGSGAYKVIGNAVPPMLAYNIARRIEDVWNLYFD